MLKHPVLVKLAHSLLLAAASFCAGLLLGAGHNLPWLGLALAVALFLWVASGRTTSGRAAKGRAALVGLGVGAGFWLPFVNWLTLYLGPVPWLALCALMVLWYTLQGLATGVSLRVLARWESAAKKKRPVSFLLLRAAVIASVWLLREVVQANWPYDGFGWGRLPALLIDTNLRRLLPFLGQNGATFFAVFAVAVTVGAVWMLVLAVRSRRGASAPGNILRAPCGRAIIAAAVVVCLPALVVQLLPPTTSVTGSVNVLAIQGNSKSGIFDDRENGDVFAAHRVQTERALRQARKEGLRPDLVVWPENAAEFNATGDLLKLYPLTKLAKQAGAPLVVGTILPGTEGTEGEYFNSSVAISTGGRLLGQVDKRYPVPFGEYMPNREFYRMFAPDLVDLVQLSYTKGTREPVMQLAKRDGKKVSYGVAICFDIVNDEHTSRMLRDGAQIILAQTNNADFGRTVQSWQQLQIARVQAAVTGRAVVNISTVGTSALIRPDGTVSEQLPTHAARTLQVEAPLVTANTPALLIGAPLTPLLILPALCLLLAAGVAAVRSRIRHTGRGSQPHPRSQR